MKFYDLHTHTTHSDGQASPWEMVHAAEAVGVSHIALTDHLDMTVAGGNWVDQMTAAAKDLPPDGYVVKLLVGAEVWAIGRDGDISVDEPTAKKLDLILCDIAWHHLGIEADEVEAMETADVARMLADIYVKVSENPLVDIIAHPFPYGRAIPRPVEPDDLPRDCLGRVAAAMAETGTGFDVMSNTWWWYPQINPRSFTESYANLVRPFVQAGVKFSIGSDAHSVGGVGNLRWSLGLLKELGVTEEQMIDPDDFLNRSR